MERNTAQRRAIRAVLEAAGRPLSTAEVLKGSKKAVPGIGMATVYRTLGAFVDEKIAVAVALPDEPPRYEMAGKEHHHHFRCRKCERVFEVEGCVGALKTSAPRGFRVERHEVVLYGLCPGCRKSA